MAKKLVKKQNEKNEEVVNEVEELEVCSPIDEDEHTFELQCGYTDNDGITHTKIVLREMIGKDEEAIASKASKNENNVRKVYDLISRCTLAVGSLTPSSMNKAEWRQIFSNMYVGDLDTMLMELRRISIGEEVTLNHTCPNCNTQLNTIVELDEFEIKHFKGETVIDIELPKGYRDTEGKKHKKGTLTLPIGLDAELLNNIAKTNVAKAETFLLDRKVSLEGVATGESVMAELSIGDRKYLQNLLNEHSFGVETMIDVTCPECGHIFKGQLSANFF